jgi:hypothetical protein
MNCIIMVELETDAPLEAFEGLGNVSIEVSKGGMVWKPNVRKLKVFKAEEDEDEELIAIRGHPKALKNLSPFNMGMHMGMSNTSGGD